MTLSVPITRTDKLAGGVKRPESIVVPKVGKLISNNITFGALELRSDKLIKNIRWLGDDFTSAGQRFVTGVTALFIQPWFDWNNSDVDKKTRKTSTARTIGKIIVSTTTGVLIRAGLIKITSAFTKNKFTEEALVKKGKKDISNVIRDFTKSQQWLLPKELKNGSFREIQKYRNTVGTFLAVFVMIGTNFLIDAPLTIYITNKLTKFFIRKDSKQDNAKSIKGGN